MVRIKGASKSRPTKKLVAWTLRVILIGLAFTYYYVIVNLFMKQHEKYHPPINNIENGRDIATSLTQKQQSLITNFAKNSDNQSSLRQRQPSTNTHNSIISRNDKVKIDTDVRGNLGPPEAMIQKIPGTDWLKDRWQAASDMHGTAIPGVHWVTLEFPSVVTSISQVVLDWEAAYARDYRIEVSMENDEWNVLFDSHVDSELRKTSESGQSPGVKTKTPLHVVHTIALSSSPDASKFKYLRLYIRKSAMGWGVSLWQLDVYGVMLS